MQHRYLITGVKKSLNPTCILILSLKIEAPGGTPKWEKLKNRTLALEFIIFKVANLIFDQFDSFQLEMVEPGE